MLQICSQLLIIILPLISSYLFLTVLVKKEDIIDKLNIGFLLLSCQLILVTQLLSLFKALNYKCYLGVTAVLFLISIFVSKKTNKSLRFDLEQINLLKNRLYQYLKTNKLLTIFFYVMLISFLWRMFLIIYVPPNNWDSMTYHLSRVAYWIQNQSLGNFYTHNLRQTVFPFNAEILLLWTMIASRCDFLCGFVQFVCYLLAGTLLYKCLRQYLRVEVLPSLALMFIWYSLPEVVLQSTSTQNDLVVAYFLMFCLVYFLLGIASRVKYLILSAIALGVAIGTKLSALFFLPAFIFLLLFLSVGRLVILRRIFSWVIIFVIALLFLGSFSFIQNYLQYHDFLGSADREYLRYSSATLKDFYSKFAQHLFNLATNQSGLHFYSHRLSRLYNAITARLGIIIFHLFHIPDNAPGSVFYGKFAFNSWVHKFRLQEDAAFFGLTGMLMIFLAIYIFFVGAIKLCRQDLRFNQRYLIFVFLFFSYLAVLSHFMQWDPWQSRHMLIMVITGMPILALIFNSNTPFFRRLSSCIIVYSILLLIPSTFMNENKPLSALHKDELELRCIMHRDMESIIRKFDSLVPPNSKVGVILVEDSWDYPLFGKDLKRRIIPANREIVQSEKFDFIVAIQRLLEENERLSNVLSENYIMAEQLGEERDNKWVLYIPKLNG